MIFVLYIHESFSTVHLIYIFFKFGNSSNVLLKMDGKANAVQLTWSDRKTSCQVLGIWM